MRKFVHRMALLLLLTLLPIATVIGIMTAKQARSRQIPCEPRPMFHVLNTGEIRGFGGPDWHIGLDLIDRFGRHIYIDKEVNLIVTVCLPVGEVSSFTRGPDYSPESTTFYPETEHEITVPLRQNSIVVYQREQLVDEASLSGGGARRIVDEWFRLQDAPGSLFDFQSVLDSLGIPVKLPPPINE